MQVITLSICGFVKMSKFINIVADIDFIIESLCVS